MKGVHGGEDFYLQWGSGHTDTQFADSYLRVSTESEQLIYSGVPNFGGAAWYVRSRSSGEAIIKIFADKTPQTIGYSFVFEISI